MTMDSSLEFPANLGDGQSCRSDLLVPAEWGLSRSDHERVYAVLSIAYFQSGTHSFVQLQTPPTLQNHMIRILKQP